MLRFIAKKLLKEVYEMIGSLDEKNKNVTLDLDDKLRAFRRQIHCMNNTIKKVDQKVNRIEEQVRANIGDCEDGKRAMKLYDDLHAQIEKCTKQLTNLSSDTVVKTVKKSTKKKK